MLKKRSISIFMIITLCFSMSITAYGEDMTGYAVYRDGVVGPVEWHGALMWGNSSTSTSKPIVHQPGYGYTTFDTWNNFLDGNEFQGYYETFDSPTLHERAVVAGTANRLSKLSIPYCLYYLLETSLDTTDESSERIYPEDITALRCDGVIEYCNEFNGHMIFGNDFNWDISLARQATMAKHSITNITPKKQASGYMNKRPN